MICWFADFFIHEDLMVNFWVPFLSRDFWIVHRLKTREMMTSEEVHGLKPPTFVQMLLNCDCFFRSFSIQKSQLLRKRSTGRTHQQKVIGAEWKLKQQECPTRFLFVGRLIRACHFSSMFPPKFWHWILEKDVGWHIDSLQRLSFVSSKVFLNQEAGTNLLDFSHLLQRNHSFFSSAAFPPDPGIAIHQILHSAMCQRCVLRYFFFFRWKGATRSVTCYPVS